MFPLWDSCIAPLLEAAEVRTVVEIGALRGETTIQMLDRLGPDVELHVIDPAPEFDPSDHERRFPGRYVFHRDISHNVLAELGPVDAALIDGDHNWYTVYHELRMLREAARKADRPLPLLVMHDVLWPYGRRDMYYDPERIPQEHRQPFDQRGMAPHARRLLPAGRGGLSPTMNNALEEGGPENGVMTALDDFIDEHDRPLRRIVIPIYFGLAIVVEEDRLARQPALAEAIEQLESPESLRRLLELGEQLRIKAMVFQHNVYFDSQKRLDASAHRYLELVKGVLLDEHYLENEVRLGYLATCLAKDKEPEPASVRDPARYLAGETRRLREQRRVGGQGAGRPVPPSFFPFTEMGRARLTHLERCLDTVREESVDGDLVDCGTGRGGGAMFLRAYLEAHQVPGRQVWVADAFRAAGPRPGPVELADTGSRDLPADLNLVREGFDRLDLLDDRVRFLQGPAHEMLPDAPLEKVALLRIGGGDDVAVGSVLDAVYDRITPGGFVVVDGCDDPAVAEEVAAFRAARAVPEPLQRVDHGALSWRKLEHAPGAATAGALRRPSGPPAVAPVATDGTDLSVIVVFYNMKREASRTLHSLSRAYQRDVADLDYEVIVVENGSQEDQRLGEGFVRSFGPEFRYLDLGGEATPSPTDALNRGLALARGETIAFMIDGAHVLTPGVLHLAMVGLSTYAPAIVATQQWYVGPGQQGDVMLGGYDQAREDRLFGAIDWPSDGYRLFDIGHFVGDRDWFDGMWESNAVFVPRRLLEQVGAMDPSFAMPGGGYANLDFYERIGSSPDVTVVSILGEGSFHQVHGGTTTNQTDLVEKASRLAGYEDHYRELRGKPFKGPGKPIHFVGSLPGHARRTKARRMTAQSFFTPQEPHGPDGLAPEPVPVAQDFRQESIDVYWQSQAWKQNTWLRTPLPKCPADLFAYQELLASVRPDWVIETGRAGGGRALFLASICELLDHGRVLSIGEDGDPTAVDHHRVTWIDSHPLSPRTMRRVRETVGEEPHALVVLGSQGTRHRTLNEFETYAPLVPVGSYVVVEDTVLNGNPVWPGFGPGPAEAVREIVKRHRGRFAQDLAVDRHLVTFNPGGYLRRIG